MMPSQIFLLCLSRLCVTLYYDGYNIADITLTLLRLERLTMINSDNVIKAVDMLHKLAHF